MVIKKFDKITKKKILQEIKDFQKKNQNIPKEKRYDLISKKFDIDRKKVSYLIYYISKKDITNLGNSYRGFKTPNQDEISQKGWEHYLFGKLKRFYGSHREAKNHMENDLIRLQSNPICYLTGDPIDLTDTNSYSLDHIIPTAQGGKNESENMGLTTRWANLCKSGLNPAQFLNICQKVVSNQKV